MYRELNRYDEAEALLLRCLKIRESSVPPDELYVSAVQQALSDLYCSMAELDKAESYCSPAFHYAEKNLRSNKTAFAEYALSRASLWSAQGKFLDACKLLEKIIPEAEETYGDLNPRLLESWELYANCLRQLSRAADASVAEARAQSIADRWQIPRKKMATH